MRIPVLTMAVGIIALAISAANALEARVKGVDRDRVEIVREKPPTDIDLKKILPLPIPSANREFTHLDNDMAWHVIRDLRLDAEQAKKILSPNN